MTRFSSLCRLRSLVTIIAAVGTLAVAPAVPASASVWQLADGFEVNPQNTWWFGGNSPCPNCGRFENDPATAHNGSGFANFRAMPPLSWFAVARTVHLVPAETQPVTCTARVFVQGRLWQNLNLEIINPSNWRYIALKTVTTAPATWQSIATGPWTPDSVDVVVRVTVARIPNSASAIAQVDDLLVQCGS